MSTPLVPIALGTPAQIVAKQVVDRANSSFGQFELNYTQTYNLLWKSADPIAAIVAMGTQAQAVFAKSLAAGEYINANGGSVPLASPQDKTGNYKYTFVYNADGSITPAANPAYVA